MKTKTMKHWGVMLLILLTMPVFTGCCEDDTRSADITYYISASPDLLLFVTPKVTFFNNADVNYTYALTDEDWTTTTKEWEDETFTSTYYKKIERYTSWGAQCGMIVQYIPKENVEIENREYDFYVHPYCPEAVFKSGSKISVVQNTDITINIDLTVGKSEEGKEYDGIKQEVQSFIDKLAERSDTVLVNTGF